jgi:hypothetical protein
MNASCQFCYIIDLEVLLRSCSHFLQEGITFSLYVIRMSQDSIVSIATGYELDDRGVRF